ncbi:MAG: hypothetical protein K2X86_05425 [Cytophagaceae bacterium]|nr:hypothetical protein [Cytophagaceae bacterium]
MFLSFVKFSIQIDLNTSLIIKYFKILSLLLLLSSCDFKPNDKVVPEWEMDILGPLIKGDLTIQDIAELDSLHGKHDFSLADFGLPNMAGVPVPNNTPSGTNTPVNAGPFSTFNITDAFGSGLIESGEIYFKITNGWQINLQSGIFIFKSGTNDLINQPISTIPAYSGIGAKPSYTSPVNTFTNINTNDTLTLQVLNFTTTGGMITDVNRKLTVDVYLNNIVIGSITLSSTESFSIIDTSDFSISGNRIKSESVSGTPNTFIANPLPVDFRFQIYFMDETKTVKLDSIFDTPTIIAANSPEIKLVTTLNQTKLNNLKNSDFARTFLKLNTPPSGSVTISNSLVLKVQVVGDLKLKLSEQ